MSIHDIDCYHPTARVVATRDDLKQRDREREEFIRRHEYSLLDLFAEKHPDRILQIADKIRLQKAAA